MMPLCTTVTAPASGRSRLPRCSYHQRAFIDVETGEQLSGQVLSKKNYRPEVLTVYPSELLAWWRSEGQPVPRLPAVPSRLRAGLLCTAPGHRQQAGGETRIQLQRATVVALGTVQVTGADSTKAKGTILGDGFVRIEYDDGSGTFVEVTEPAPGSPYPCTDFFS